MKGLPSNNANFMNSVCHVPGQRIENKYMPENCIKHTQNSYYLFIFVQLSPITVYETPGKSKGLLLQS